MPQPLSSLIQNTNSEVFISSGPVVGSGGIDGGGVQIWALALYRTAVPREVLKVGDLAVKKSWSDQNLSEFSKVNLIGQI